MSITEKLQTARSVEASWLPDALMIAGAAAISCGVGMVSVPAGWVVAGAFAIAAGWLTARGGK
jgi:hypothetical protein